MKSYKCKIGLTLVEILIVVFVIGILVAMIIGIAARVNIQSNKQLTESTFALLDAALGQFQDYGYSYKNQYTGFDFPLDCSDFNDVHLRRTLEDALGVNIAINGDNHREEYSGSEALYFFLSRVPGSRKTLDKIDKSLITAEGSDGQDMKVEIDDKEEYPLLRFIDPWGETLRYDYYDESETDVDDMEKSRKTFPVITSAGPDKEFGSADDIASR